MKRMRKERKGWVRNRKGLVINPKLPQGRLRKCGPCTECCTAMYIRELDKPAGVQCEHLTSEGCGIYGEHPAECQLFACMWLDGKGTLDDRPDRAGGVAVIENHNDGLGNGLVIYTDTESKPDWKESRHLSKVADQVVNEGGACFVVGHGYRVMLTRAETEFAKRVPTIARFNSEGPSYEPVPADEWLDVMELFGQTKNPLGSEPEPD
tara:strand:+ start:6479 stop:7102 length:624 start_codon:yes stop_codon:yes gene_type:complete